MTIKLFIIILEIRRNFMRKRFRKYFIGFVIISLLIIGLAIRNAFIRSDLNDNRGKVITASTDYILSSASEETAGKFALAGKINADAANNTLSNLSGVTYPDLSRYENLSVRVSLKTQRMQILSGEKVIFEAVVSTGKDREANATPVGDFVIEPERDEFFFNENSGEGAKYAVSFKDHGVYLFHSVATDRDGNIIPEEAALLGTPCSHGCIRMSMGNAKWFYENIPEGIPVHVNED